MEERFVPELEGSLRKFMLKVPKPIENCTGIRVFGRLIKSVLFSTDVSIIRNTNADAIIAVYPFTPQPVITQAIMTGADIPVFAGVGGGLTQGRRVLNLGLHAEFQGAIGVVVNAPTKNEVIKRLNQTVDIPIVLTVVCDTDDIEKRLEAGVNILNISAASKTAMLVEKIRKAFPEVPIIATGGPNDETITQTILAGANAITWTPPSSGEVFRDIMEAYRRNEPHPPF
ncbi:MAG TPA: hydrolase [Clostridia bacterium]|nr:hydrolase [Clostridia bacterium]